MHWTRRFVITGSHNNIWSCFAFLAVFNVLFYSLFFQPPIIPKVAHDGDTKNFDSYPEDDWQKTAPAAEKDLALFAEFWLAGCQNVCKICDIYLKTHLGQMTCLQKFWMIAQKEMKSMGYILQKDSYRNDVHLIKSYTFSFWDCHV